MSELVTMEDFYGYKAHVYVSDCGTYRLYIHPYETTSMEYESIHEIRWRKFTGDEEISHNEHGAAWLVWRHDEDIEGDGPGSLLFDKDHGSYFINGENLTYAEWLDKCSLPISRKVELKSKHMAKQNISEKNLK